MIKIAKPLLLLGITLLTNSAFAAETAMADRTQLSALPAPISSEELSTMSGGASPTGLAVTTQTLSALNANNSVSADTVVTGQVSLQPGTFSGFNGIGNFVFNTGNNNNVQGTLSVTILTPPMN
jgi:hypothetical protein